MSEKCIDGKNHNYESVILEKKEDSDYGSHRSSTTIVKLILFCKKCSKHKELPIVW